MGSCAKLCLFCIVVFLVPLLLAAYAALLASNDSSSRYSNYNSDNDDSNGPWAVFFGHLIGYFFQLAATVMCFKAFLGARRQYNVLQKFLHVGSLECTGTVTRHHITSHRVNCIENRQTHALKYVYRVEDDDGSTVVYEKSKEIVYWCTLCRQVRLTEQTVRHTNAPPLIPLKLLPGQPGSGYPTLLLEEELQYYWPRTVIGVFIAASVAALVPWFLYTIGEGDTWPPIAIACLWSVGGGFWMARHQLQRWEFETLQSGLQQQQQIQRADRGETELPAVV